MAINFPISPSPNQIYSYNGLSWQWNGSYWQSFPPSSGATGVVRTITASTGLSANTNTGDVTLIVTGSTGGGTFTGGTVTGATSFTGGLSANTISATTYQNLPTDVRVTGSTYSNNTFTFTNNTGGTFNVLFNTVTGLTVNGVLTVTGNTSLQSLTTTTISATTYNNVPVVTGGTYTSGTITFNNATGGTFSVTGLPVGGQGGQLYYFNTSVTQTPYKEFGPTGDTASEQTTTISIASGITSTVESYLTPTGYPNSLIFPGGVWSFYLHAYKQDSSSSFDLYCDVYKRTSGESGTNTYLFSTDPFSVTSNAPTPTMGITDAYFSGTSLNVSDRILVLVRATNTGTSTKEISFVTEGSQRYSYGITTFNGIPANVSSLTASDGISGNSTTGAISIVNTDKGSSQNIFKNIQINENTQFSAGSNNSNLNFSGINITITSAATNTLVFSAGTGSSGGVTSIIGGSGISAIPSTGNVTVSYTGSTGGVNLGTVYTTGNNLNFI